jgi:hypothetical protein
MALERTPVDGHGSRTDPVCVLGFGRSGTSLTMRLLNQLEVALGPQEDLLRPVAADSTRGHWEPRWMVELNEEILAASSTLSGGVLCRPSPAGSTGRHWSRFATACGRFCTRSSLRRRYEGGRTRAWRANLASQ